MGSSLLRSSGGSRQMTLPELQREVSLHGRRPSWNMQASQAPAQAPVADKDAPKAGPLNSTAKLLTMRRSSHSSHLRAAGKPALMPAWGHTLWDLLSLCQRLEHDTHSMCMLGSGSVS